MNAAAPCAHRARLAAAVASLPLWLLGCGSESGAGPGVAHASETPASEIVVAVCNGHEILGREVDALVAERIGAARDAGALPGDQVDRATEAVRGQVLGELIERSLIEQRAAELGIEVTEAEIEADLRLGFEAYLLDENMTEEQFDQNVQAHFGVTGAEFFAQRLAAPDAREAMTVRKLVAQLYPDETAVGDDEVRRAYDQQVRTRFTKPRMVRARHILIAVEPDASEAEHQAARERAERLVQEARAPEADFATLAQQHSSCPSAPRGGDLGYFSILQQGLDEAFAKAAFGAEVGEVPDVVATSFGYHVLQVTDRREPFRLSFEEAAPILRSELLAERAGMARKELVADLRAEAEITFPSLTGTSG